MADTSGPTARPQDNIASELERARRELLELSTRNRLLSIPKRSKTARFIDIVDERSDETLRILVCGKKNMSFESAAATGEEDGDEGVLAQPIDDDVDERGVASRHRDTKLQTKLTSAALQKKLLALFYDSRTAIEEQGVNILYLTLGMLHWFEDTASSVERSAPLILIPVRLDRRNATSRFVLQWTEEDVAENFVLREKLRIDFGLELPALPDLVGAEPDDLAQAVSGYFDAVQSLIAGKRQWSVGSDEISLGLFSFAKYLMYKDLDPVRWPSEGLTRHPLIMSLLGEGFPPPDRTESTGSAPESLDDRVSVARMAYIVDADSTQIEAIESARAGASLVVQGPPGTGKSQSIANLIGALVADGKRVLFVAEKMAALEVVKRRLDAAGIGRIALELHSNKTNKRVILDELRQTISETEVGLPDTRQFFEQLESTRHTLTEHARILHRPHEPSGFSAFQAYSRLLKIRDAGLRDAALPLEGALRFTRRDLDERLVQARALSEQLVALGNIEEHPWAGVHRKTALPTDIDAVFRVLAQATEQLALEARLSDAAASALHLAPAPSIAGARQQIMFAAALATVPACDRAALASEAWLDVPALRQLLEDGAQYEKEREELFSNETNRVRQVAKAADELTASWRALRDGLSEDEVPTATGCLRLARVVEALSKLPDCDVGCLRASEWNDPSRLLQVIELAEKTAIARQELLKTVADIAWSIEFAPIRAAVEKHGSSFFRIFSGPYRAAIKQLRTVLVAGVELPKGKDALLPFIDQLTAVRAQAQELQGSASMMRSAFGSRWAGEESDFSALRALHAWVLQYGTEAIRGTASRGIQVASLVAPAERIARDAEATHQRTKALLGDLNTTLKEGSERFDVVSRALADPARFLDRCMQERTLTKSILARTTLGKAAFGTAWKELKSDWHAFSVLLAWHDALPELPGVAAGASAGLVAWIADDTACGIVSKAAPTYLASSDRLLRMLFDELVLDEAQVFGEQGFQSKSYATVQERFALWTERSSDLVGWISFRATRDRAVSLGLRPVVEALERREIPADQGASALESSFLNAVLRAIFEANPTLGTFEGTAHSKTVEQFRALDGHRQDVAKLEVLGAHGARLPRGTLGPMGVLNAEMAKKRRHLAVRQLMKQSGPAIQALKPVMMMSPLSVAQFLEPGGAVSFDVLIIDEASQVQPVDALGAIARAKQIVVVGDDKQMPPTRFFSRAMGDVDEDEEESLAVGDIESILGLCQAKGVSSKMLRWHYRSKHQSLIAVSNHEFYDGKLFIVPSPSTKDDGVGLFFRHLPNAVYDRGGSATNKVEARAIAAAVMRHVKEHPNLTLGVATFSMKQRQLILDELELARRDEPAGEAFFSSGGEEPFFVKNLENVQGDERDVIFISVCYGRDEKGFMTMNFGPLNNDGGERRLNVLISRARRRCEVFTPITDDDIDLERTSARGVRALKAFLHYARTGELEVAMQSDRDFDSPFEESVARALRARGFEVHTQVGQSGFFVDLAVIDPERRGRYLLGIECDGASYRASRSARDRDRLRQAVLEAHGWTIHRIWSTDWFLRQNDEVERVVRAVQDAMQRSATYKSGSAPPASPPVTPAASAALALAPTLPKVKVKGAVSLKARNEPVAAADYDEASFPVDYARAPHELPVSVMAGYVLKVVHHEGPIHCDEIVVRIRNLWLLGRAGARVQTAVVAAILDLTSDRRVERTGDFLDIPRRPVRIRNRAHALSASSRKAVMLPPTEIRAAASQIVTESAGAAREELTTAVARLLGVATTGAGVKKVVDAQIDLMIDDGTLVAREGFLVLGQRDAAAPREAG